MKRVPFALITFLVFLALDILFLVLYHLVGGEQFDLDWEENLPTTYQSLKLVAAALVAVILTVVSRPIKKEMLAWGAFALGLAYLGLDEWLQIHEEISRITDEFLLSTTGRVSFSAWIIPYIPVMIAAAFALYFVYKNVVKAPKYTKHKIHYWFFAACAALFAVPVVEVLGSAAWDFEGQANVWVITLEEGLEMLGITLVAAMLVAVLRVKLYRKGE